MESRTPPPTPRTGPTGAPAAPGSDTSEPDAADAAGRGVCPICLSTELTPQNQCTLRCGHALCNLCLPQLLSPNCPLCRQPIWSDNNNTQQPRHTPWLLENTPLLENHQMEDDLSTLSTNDNNSTNSENHTQARIPVMLLTRAQLRRFFPLDREDEEDREQRAAR